jgi:regulator of nonsense transcripts 2
MIGTNSAGRPEDDELLMVSGGKWEDEEERRFFEDLQDLRDFVPKSVLGLGEGEDKASVSAAEQDSQHMANVEKERVEEDLRKLDEELAGLQGAKTNGLAKSEQDDEDDYEYAIQFFPFLTSEEGL